MNKQKPKLCYVLPEYRSDDAPHFAHIHDFLKEASQRFDIFLLIEKGTPPPKELGVASFYVLSSKKGFARTIETIRILWRVQRKGFCDMYVHYSFSAAFWGSLIVRLRGTGRVYYWNCGEPWKYTRPFFREQFERMTYRLITFLVTGAETMRRGYNAHYSLSLDRIKVMPNWIDLMRFKALGEKTALRRELGIPLDAKVVIFAHRLSERKGAHRILPVAREVTHYIPNVLFLIAGDGPLGEKIIAECTHNGITNVRLLGSVPNNELPRYMASADAFFMPSDEEGFPRVILETIALGLPFVASNVGAVRDIVPQGASRFIVESSDEAGYVKGLVTLLSQDNTTLREEAKAWVRTHYDLPVVINHFEKLFKR